MLDLVPYGPCHYNMLTNFVYYYSNTKLFLEFKFVLIFIMF